VSENADEREPVDESREASGERAARPDVQAGALRMSEGDEPEEHEFPSFRERADEPEDEAEGGP
jgi:hypothetical protein